MSERWVKATIVQNGTQVWVNVVLADGLVPMEGGTRVGLRDGSCQDFKEPPEHFLPRGAFREADAWAFIHHLANIPEIDAASPSIVREAKRIRAMPA